MEEFLYRARDFTGETVRGKVLAQNSREAARYLKARNLYISSLRQDDKWDWRRFWLHRKVPPAYAAFFCRQLSVLLPAGMSLADSMKVLAQQEQRPACRAMLKDLSAQIEEGNSLAAGLRQYKEFFPHYMLAALGAGEVGGTLELILPRLADYLSQSNRTKDKLRTIMLYPLFLGGTALLVLIFLTLFVFPVFASLFASLSVELPLFTRLVLGLGNMFLSYGWLLPFLLAAAVGVCYKFYKNEYWRLRIDRGLLGLPFCGRLVLRLTVMRLAGTLSLLLRSGMSVDKALKMSVEVTENRYIRRVLFQASDRVCRGHSISSALGGTNLFSPTARGLLAVGDVTGEVDMMLDRIEALSREESARMTERAQACLEPAAVLVLGIIIGIMVLSMALPILDTMTAFS